MTVPYSSDLYKAVLPGGAVTLEVMFETWYGSAVPQPVTGVTVTITAVGATSPVLGPTSAGITTVDQATYTYQWLPPTSTTPGDYSVAFTGTGPNGTITYTQAVTVAAVPDPSPAPGAYATVGQYQAWSGDKFSPNDLVTIALRRASEVIDRALIGAVYATDANSMPTDPGVIDVFMRATCAQAQFILANNDFANVKSQYATTSMGGVSQTRAQTAQNQVFPPLASQAAAILQVAGVLPGAPLVNW